PQPHAVRLAPDRAVLRGTHLPLHRGEERQRPGGARSVHVTHRRRPTVLLPPARAQRGRCNVHDRQRVLQGRVRRPAHGIRGRGPGPPPRQPRRERGLMLSIKGLTASVEGSKVLKGLDLEIAPGEVHAVMGPNGAGKSTLASVLAGRDGYTVSGDVLFEGQNLLDLDPEERAVAGVFLAFQYPTEIPGVGNMYFLRTAANAVREAR